MTSISKRASIYRNAILIFVVFWVLLLTITSVTALKPISVSRLEDANEQIAEIEEEIANGEKDSDDFRYNLLKERQKMLPQREHYYTVCMIMIMIFIVAGMLFQMIFDLHFAGPFGAFCMLLAIGVTFRTIYSCDRKSVLLLALAMCAVVVGYFVSGILLTRLNVHNYSIGKDHENNRHGDVVSVVLYIGCMAVIAACLVWSFAGGITDKGAVTSAKITDDASFQPGEIIKLFLLCMGALSYKKLSRTIVYFLTAIVCCVVFMYHHDLGAAAILATVAIIMLILLIDNRNIVAIIIVSLLILAGLAVLVLFAFKFDSFTYAMDRITNTWHAMELENGEPTQQGKLLRALVFGGIGGLGFGESIYTINITDIEKDMVVGGITAVFGLGMLVIVIVCYLITVLLPLLNTAKSSLAYFVLAQTAVLLTVQILLNFLGSIDVIPFTGVVSPILSEGGTSLIVFSGLYGLVFGSLNQSFGKLKEETRS